MAGKGPNLDDYIEVAERIVAFKEAHPEGSLQAEIHTLTDSLVVMRAFAYRTPDDQRPGVGWSSLGIPGATSFTRGSEIENCETSAWGRAIAALGFEVRRGVSSAQEVRNKEQPKADLPVCAEHDAPYDTMNPNTKRRAHKQGAGWCVQPREPSNA